MQEALKLEERLIKAMIRSDCETLNALIADSLIESPRV